MCPSFLFGSPLYTLSSSVVWNSPLSSRTYLFCSLEKRSPKSTESRNVQQLACAILKCVNSLISNLCKPARNVTCAQYFTAFIEHKHWIKVITCIIFSIYKKRVHMFVSFLKNVSHYCFMRWGQKFRKCIVLLRWDHQTNSQYNMCSIKLLMLVETRHPAFLPSILTIAWQSLWTTLIVLLT